MAISSSRLTWSRWVRAWVVTKISHALSSLKCSKNQEAIFTSRTVNKSATAILLEVRSREWTQVCFPKAKLPLSWPGKIILKTKSWWSYSRSKRAWERCPSRSDRHTLIRSMRSIKRLSLIQRAKGRVNRRKLSTCHRLWAISARLLPGVVLN